MLACSKVSFFKHVWNGKLFLQQMPHHPGVCRLCRQKALSGCKHICWQQPERFDQRYVAFRASYNINMFTCLSLDVDSLASSRAISIYLLSSSLQSLTPSLLSKLSTNSININIKQQHHSTKDFSPSFYHLSTRFFPLGCFPVRRILIWCLNVWLSSLFHQNKVKT